MGKGKFKGDVGIGTLIVFIAMVLVAAIAATVLLNVSGMLQQKASATGKQTTEQISSNLQVISIMGYQNDVSDNNIVRLIISLKASAGSSKIDLRNLMLRINNGTTEARLFAQSNGSQVNNATNTYFGLIERVDPNNLFNATNTVYVIDHNSLIDLNVSLLSGAAGINMNITPRANVELELVPEIGAPVHIEMTAPSTFSTLNMQLYP